MADVNQTLYVYLGIKYVSTYNYLFYLSLSNFINYDRSLLKTKLCFYNYLIGFCCFVPVH